MWCYVAPCPKYPYPQKDPAEEVARGKDKMEKKGKRQKIGHTVRFGRVWKMDNSRKLRPENDVFLFLVKARRALDGEGVIVRSCYNSFPDRQKKTSLFRLVLFLPVFLRMFASLLPAINFVQRYSVAKSI